jgi:hypothetical protein
MRRAILLVLCLASLGLPAPAESPKQGKGPTEQVPRPRPPKPSPNGGTKAASKIRSTPKAALPKVPDGRKAEPRASNPTPTATHR